MLYPLSMSLNELSSESLSEPKEYPFPKASPQHRLGAIALDAVLSSATFGIGWIIWSLVVWGQGQTPGKQILRLRVYDQDKKAPVMWGHMALRQFAIPFAISLGFWALILPAGGWAYETGGNLPQSGVLSGLYFIYLCYFLLDAFWILKGTNRRRLVDLIAKTDVLNEAAPGRDTKGN